MKGYLYFFHCIAIIMQLKVNNGGGGCKFLWSNNYMLIRND